MNYPRVNSIDDYQNELMGYNIIGNKIVYLTETQLCIVRVGKKIKKESAKIKGSSILNFVISKRGYLAFLYKNRTIQIRRMDNLNDIVHKFANITIFSDGSYPKMKWDYDELYLIYPQNIEILDLKTKARKGYTDIVVDYDNQKMMDMVIANIMDTERAIILQLGNRLIFTIIPIPVSQLQIPFINSVLNLYSPSHINDSRRQFIAVLSNGNLLKIYNLLNLKQICQIDLQPKANQLLQMESDSNHECLLIRYISSSTLEITKNVIYKINSAYYYCQNYNYYGEKEPFFTYKFQIPIDQNLTLFPMTVEEINNQIFDYYHLIFFKKGHVYSVFQFIPHSYSQTPTQLKYKTKTDWKEVEEWKEIISTYLELTGAELPKNQKNLNFVQQERQLHQYNIIKQEFDSIIAKFTAKINQQNKKRTLNQKMIQDEWNDYMAQIAKERNFMLETMKLFKIEPQVIRKNQTDKPEQKTKNEAQEKQQKQRQNRHATLAKELETCIRQIQSRQERIDAKIKQKKKETEIQKKAKVQITEEQKQKYQEDYQKFVAQFMLQKEKKQREEIERKAKKQQFGPQLAEQRLILALPHLNQQEKRTISHYTGDLNLSDNNHSLSIQREHLQSSNTQHPQKIEWPQIDQILKDIQNKINPFIERFQLLIDRLKNVESEGLSRIKKNQEAIRAKCSLNLQQMVKNCCKSMLSNINNKIKKQIESATRQIYKLEDKNKAYYEDSIDKFKQYIQFQIQNRIQVFYKSRKRLELKISEMTQQSYQQSSTTKQ